MDDCLNYILLNTINLTMTLYVWSFVLILLCNIHNMSVYST